MHFDKLKHLVEHRQAVIGIVGLGYVGLPLLLRFCEAGYKVVGFDNDEMKLDSLHNGKSYIRHISGKHVESAIQSGCEFRTDFASSREVDVFIICVPTPLSKYRDPDISYITATMDAIVPQMRPGQLISLESTTYPGTTEEEIVPRVIAAGLTPGVDTFIVFSPEREDPGNPKYTTRTIPKVCGGYTPFCSELGRDLYTSVIDEVVVVSDTRTAEMTKLLENIHRAVNIGLVNEMKVLADRMGIDIYEVIRAAATKPFGFVPYYPGPGLGGHCIPIDPFYLTYKAREFGMHTRFIELAGEINSSMPDYVLSKVNFALNRESKPVKGSRVLVLGLAYKKNIDDMRESPSVYIISKLMEAGALVAYHDPFIPKFSSHEYPQIMLDSIVIDEENVSSFDCVILCTDHDNLNYRDLSNWSKLLVDCRGRLPSSNKVVRA